MKNNAIWWIIGIVIVVGLGYLIFNQPNKTNDKKSESVATAPVAPKVVESSEVTIGWIGPLTGDAAAYGIPLQKATMLAAEEINAAGGVGGKKLVVAYEDGNCDGKGGAAAAQKLISINKVQIIIGGTCSGETLGFTPIANENKVVVFSPSASSPDLTTKGGDYAFRFYPSDALAGKVAASYAMDTFKAKKAAVITANTDYAQGLHRVFVESFKNAGGEVTVDESYNSGTTDFRTQALKIKNAKVDVVYIVVQLPTEGIALVKALKDQKIVAPLLTAEILIGREIAKNNKDVLEGVIGFEAFFDEKAEGAAKFTAAFKAKYNEDLAFPFMQTIAYSEGYLFKEMIEKYGNDGVKIQAALAKLTDWSGGGLKNMTLDENGDVVWKSFSIKKITNGDVPSIGVFDMK